MNVISRIYIALILGLCAPVSAFAEDLHLICNGAMSTGGADDSKKEFELNVDTKTGEIFGFPLSIAFPCGMTDAQQEITKGKTKFGLFCSSKDGFSTLVLSRQTGVLEVTTVFNSTKKMFSGNYRCKKAGKPAF